MSDQTMGRITQLNSDPKATTGLIRPIAPPVTVKDARKKLISELDEGTTCPCCGRFAKRYVRRLNGPMAAVLVYMLREGRRQAHLGARPWLHVESMLRRHKAPTSLRGDFAKLRHWNLIEQKPADESEDKGPRSGIWRLTPFGMNFVDRRVTVPERVSIWNGQATAIHSFKTSIDMALRSGGFSWSDIMRAKPKDLSSFQYEDALRSGSGAQLMRGDPVEGP